MADLRNKVALVTGAAQGIGAATAKRLARDGASVVVADLDESRCKEVVEEIVGAGGRAIGVGCDVTSSPQVYATVARAVSEFDALHILVNNAGITRDNLLFRMTEDEWDAVITTHLKGSFLCSRAAQAQMVEQRYGKIVNISSQSANGNPGQANYAAAKAGLQGFTRTLAKELGKFGVNVNAVAPGYVVSAMTRATAERVGVEFDEHQRNAMGRIPIGRVGVPEDIANTIAFLVSDESSFITGQVLYVNGGVS